MHNVFHVGLLKPYHPGGDGRMTPGAVQLADEVEPEYEVEAILRHRTRRGGQGR